MLDKDRTIKRALRKIGINYTSQNTNKRIIEAEAYDAFDDIILDLLANKNFTFNAKTSYPTEAPEDKRLANNGIRMRRWFIPSDFLNIIETNITDLEIDGGHFTSREGINDFGVSSDLTPSSYWIKYCFKGDHSLVPEYFSKYVSTMLAYELALVFKPADKSKQETLMQDARDELANIDRAQMSNRPYRPDGSVTARLGEIRGR